MAALPVWRIERILPIGYLVLDATGGGGRLSLGVLLLYALLRVSIGLTG